MVTRRWTITALALAVLGVATLGTVKLVAANTDRADCPGKIVCPQTGKLICRDKCPTVDKNRPDCPGRIICPITGKLVCKDRCPALSKTVKGADTKVVPPCCRRKG